MTIDEDININYSPVYGCPAATPLGYKPPEDGMYITGELIRKMHEEHKKQEKEENDARIKSMLPNLDNANKLIDYVKANTGKMPASPRIIHDNSVAGVHQDPISGDVILGEPIPVGIDLTQESARTPMRMVTEVPFHDGTNAVVDPLLTSKEMKVTTTSLPVGDHPKVIIKPRGMFNHMRFEVWKYASEHLDKSDRDDFPFNDETVYIVWSCKTLQNWKALISTSLRDGMYYECTYNGDKKVLYFDAYKKFDHKEIKLDEDVTEESIKQENKRTATSAVKVRNLPRNE